MQAKKSLFLIFLVFCVCARAEDVNKPTEAQKELKPLQFNDQVPINNHTKPKTVRKSGVDLELSGIISTQSTASATLPKPTIGTTTEQKIINSIDHREEKAENIAITNDNNNKNKNTTVVESTTTTTTTTTVTTITTAKPMLSSNSALKTDSTTVAPTTTKLPSTTTTTTKAPTTTPKQKKPKITISLEDDPNLLRLNEETLKKKQLSDKMNSKLSVEVEEPNLAFSREEPLKKSHRDLIIPLVSLIFAVPLFLGLCVVAFRRAKDYWMTRHYSRMDFLVDGMYNY